MIREGLWLMGIGMTGVFVFLFVLVGLMQASGRFWRVLDRFLPERVPVRATASPSPAAGSGGGGPAATGVPEREVAVAIAIAVAARRGRSV